MSTSNSELDNEHASDNEIAYRKKHYSDIKAVEDEQITCTSCKKLLDISVEKVFAHPLLETLQCKNCFDYIKKKEDSKEEGNYCRMCGNPDYLHACKNDKCSYKFCRKCILAHLNLSLKDLKAQNWQCFKCNIKSLWELRAICDTVFNSFQKSLKKNMSARRASKKTTVEQVSRIKDSKRRTVQKPHINGGEKERDKHATSSNTSDSEYIESTQKDSQRKKKNGFMKLQTSKSTENNISHGSNKISHSKLVNSNHMVNDKKRMDSDDSNEGEIDQSDRKKSKKNTKILDNKLDSEKIKHRRSTCDVESDSSSETIFETPKLSSLSNRKNKMKNKSGEEQSQEELFDLQINKIWNALIRTYRDNKTIVEYIKQTYHDRRNKSIKSSRHFIEKSQNLIVKCKESLNEREEELLHLNEFWKSNFKKSNTHLNTPQSNDECDSDNSSIKNEQTKNNRNKDSDSSITSMAEDQQHIVSDFSSNEIFSNTENDVPEKTQDKQVQNDHCNKKTLEDNEKEPSESDNSTVEMNLPMSLSNEENNSSANETPPGRKDSTNDENTEPSSPKVHSNNEENNSSTNETLPSRKDSTNDENTEPSSPKVHSDNEENIKKSILESSTDSLGEQSDSNKTKKLPLESNSTERNNQTKNSKNDNEATINNTQNELADKTALLQTDSSSDENNIIENSLVSNSDDESVLKAQPQNSDTTEDNLEEKSSKLVSSSDSNDEEEKMKKSLLSSDSNDQTTEVDDEQQIKNALLQSDSNEECQQSSTDTYSTFLSDESSKIRRKKSHGENNNNEKQTVSPSSSSALNDKKKKCKLDDRLSADKKLRMKCRVDIEKLPQSIVEKHTHAIEKSKLFLECIKIKSLVNLERLEKKSSAGSRTSKKLEQNSKSKSSNQENEETLLDHLKKIENGEMEENQDTSNDDTDLDSSRIKDVPKTTDNLMLEADQVCKDILLNTSDSDFDEFFSNPNTHDTPIDKNKKRKRDTDSNVSTEKNKNDEDKDKEEKKDWRNNKLLRMKFSDSDTEVENEKWTKSLEKQKFTKKNNIHSDSDIEEIMTPRKKHTVKRRVLDSDSDVKLTDCEDDSDATSDTVENFKKSQEHKKSIKEKSLKRTKRQSSSDSDSLIEAKRPKPKRKRIQNLSSDDSDIETLITPENSFNKGRKNIRKVLKDQHMAQDTQQAAKDEEERLKRITERQKMYNSMCEGKSTEGKKIDSLVLDFDPETKEELMTVDEKLVKQLKPHQAKGVQFMWDACFESVDRLKTSKGSGCIIAHCMGLGKTLQVITLAHTVLTDERTGINTILVVCPLNTVLNWVNEFNTWLRDVKNSNDIEIFELTKFKKNFERQYVLQNWQKTGGVLIIGYEMFRNLIKGGKKMRKKMQDSINESLLDPGPDLVVCDEGHLLKNEDTALSKAMRQVRTLRRIILTGTPLQNNLKEYHCMVQFVKPNLLGTRNEFLNRFVNPITNGQFDDSTEYDVKLMKKRAHVLHKMLEGCVQRYDYLVLRPFLPPKHEYVIYVKLTEVQVKMYQYYLDNFARTSRAVGGSLFADFQGLQRIWTHPMVLRMNSDKIGKSHEKKTLTSDSEGSLKDFIDDGDESGTNSSSNSDDNNEISKRSTRNNSIAEDEIAPREEKTEVSEWWSQFVEPEQLEDMRISTKLVLLFAILKECEEIGDKVLVFSQSLFSLTLIENFLSQIDDETQGNRKSSPLNGHIGSWSLGLDYFRLDGQTSADNRNRWCKIFNRPTNTRARLFLISTRAGGLGINLTAANRVIIFDASWNPSHDVQSIFRVYRFGQKKPSYIYRFLAAGTMEEKIYNRQVTKLSLSCRVIDEQQIERHYSNNDLNELYRFEPNPKSESTLHFPSDRLLAEILSKHKDTIVNCLEHDSLLENKADEGLDEEERKQAWLEYEEEKKGKLKQMMPNPVQTQMNYANVNDLMKLQQQYNMMFNKNNVLAFNDMLSSMNLNYASLKEMIRKDYPHASSSALDQLVQKKVMYMYEYTKQQQQQSAKMMAQNLIPGVIPTINLYPNPSFPNNHQEIDDDEIIEIPTSSSNQSNIHLPSTSNKKKPPQLED